MNLVLDVQLENRGIEVHCPIAVTDVLNTPYYFLRISFANGFNYKAGQWFFIHSRVRPFEWHPFTIVSKHVATFSKMKRKNAAREGIQLCQGAS